MNEVMNPAYVFPILLALISMVTVIFMPKHLTKREIYVTWIMLGGLTVFVDIILNGLDLIEYVAEGLQPMVTVLRAVGYPALGIIFLNFMPEGTFKFVLYAVLWVAIFLTIETINTLTGYLFYYKWSIFYSAIFYALLCVTLRWHIHFIRSAKIST